MAIIKFKTRRNANRIEPVEVVRETEKCVFFTAGGIFPNKAGERREAKHDSYAQYHDSWSDAHKFLTEREQSKVNDARRQLELANASLGNVKGMKQGAAS